MSATFEDLLAVDDALVRAGHHPMTAWWRETLREFYEHPSARALCARVGRGGAKSFNSCKVAVTETLFGNWNVPPGERHYWANISITKDEAAQRLTLLQSFLRALGVGFDLQGDTINLRGMPRGFRVLACQVGSVSGYRIYGYSADELAKWAAGYDFANPAEEVCASADAMSITHPGARRLLISSPWGLDDYHAKQFARGNTDDQIVVYAPTWIANPSVTEAHTITMAHGDTRIHSREYLAVPGQVESAALDFDLVNEAFSKHAATAIPAHAPVSVLLDPSALRGDRFTMCAVAEFKGRLAIVDVASLESGSSTFHEVIPKIVEFCKKHRARTVYSDQYEQGSLSAQLTQRGYTFKPHSWNATTKSDALATIRRMLLERVITFASHADMRSELIGLRARLQPNDNESVNTNGKDFAALVFLLANCVNERTIRSSAAPGAMTMAEALRSPHARANLSRVTASFGGADYFDGVPMIW